MNGLCIENTFVLSKNYRNNITEPLNESTSNIRISRVLVKTF